MKAASMLAVLLQLASLVRHASTHSPVRANIFDGFFPEQEYFVTASIAVLVLIAGAGCGIGAGTWRFFVIFTNVVVFFVVLGFALVV